jgi:hypothetical protein
MDAVIAVDNSRTFGGDTTMGRVTTRRLTRLR